MSVRHAMLALLSEGPKYGLQLREEFEARTGEVWPLNVGQVYTTLQRLERDGLAESDDSGAEGPQKGFQITAAGERELAEWLRTPPDLSSPPRDELVMKVLVALRLPGTDVREVVQAHRRYLVQLMQQWTKIKEAEADDLGLVLAVDAELFRLDSVIRWLDMADARISRAGAGVTLPAHRAAAEAAPEGRNAAMSMLELRGVSKTYGEGAAQVQALADVSLSVDAGSMVAVMGPSGSGKSTLLTIAGSLEEPTEGAVLVDGRALAQMSRPAKAQLRRRVVGYVFQDFNLLPGLTAIENVSLPLELDGLARKARSIGLQALEQLGLAERSSQYPDQLSGGERQRVAIARAIVGERRLLLADEPSGALDSTNAEAVMRLLHDACKQKSMAAVVVTHDAQLASWADRVVFLRDGRVVDQTSPVPGPESLLAPGQA